MQSWRSFFSCIGHINEMVKFFGSFSYSQISIILDIVSLSTFFKISAWIPSSPEDLWFFNLLTYNAISYFRRCCASAIISCYIHSWKFFNWVITIKEFLKITGPLLQKLPLSCNFLLETSRFLYPVLVVFTLYLQFDCYYLLVLNSDRIKVIQNNTAMINKM